MAVSAALQPGEATETIRRIARSRSLTLAYRLHAMERLAERGLIISDILFALKNGFVYTPGTPAKKEGLWRYCVECRTPNSGSRTIGVIVIPKHDVLCLTVITVMWIDELERRAGSIIGENDARD